MERRKIVIATMHHKESVIAPIFESALSVECILPENFNSDQFGTFSGELERKKSPLETALEKAKLAMEMTGCDAAISSEGSFGPHPFIPFAPANEEFMIFLDVQNDLQITERILSTSTNFASKTVESFQDLRNFLQQVDFPNHGVILKSLAPIVKYVKGVQSEEEILNHYEQLLKESTNILVETDMRAMHNPTRMKVISELAQKLADRIISLCPSCDSPGFGLSRKESGLPCTWCGNPTESILKNISCCVKCSHQEEELFPDGKKVEDPTYCQSCNP